MPHLGTARLRSVGHRIVLGASTFSSSINLAMSLLWDNESSGHGSSPYGILVLKFSGSVLDTAQLLAHKSWHIYGRSHRKAPFTETQLEACWT